MSMIYKSIWSNRIFFTNNQHFYFFSGVGLTFLFSAAIMVTTTVLFLAGSASEILVCDPLRDPSHSEVITLIADHVNLEKHYPPGQAPHLTEIIRLINCFLFSF